MICLSRRGAVGSSSPGLSWDCKPSTSSSSRTGLDLSLGASNSGVGLSLGASSPVLVVLRHLCLHECLNRIHRNTHQNLKREPPVANAFDVKEKLVCVRLRFVQCPRGALISRFHCDIFNCRNSHIRMCFQTKRNNRYANEKDGHNAHELVDGKRKKMSGEKTAGRQAWRESIKNHINFSVRLIL